MTYAAGLWREFQTFSASALLTSGRKSLFRRRKASIIAEVTCAAGQKA